MLPVGMPDSRVIGSSLFGAAPAGAMPAPGLSALLLAVPALLLALVALPFRYDVTLAEPDLARMMAALLYGHATGANELAGMHYGLSFSFGYYKLLYALAPAEWLRHPDLAAHLINVVGIAAGLLCAWTCTCYLSRLLGLTAGVCASLLFFLSPVMLPVALSGHPLVPAAACAFAAGWLFLEADETGSRRLRLACLGAAFLLLVAGLTLRAEIALAFPFFWLAGSRSGAARRWWPYAWRAALLGAAFLAFLFLQQGFVESEGGAAGRLGRFLASFMSPALIGRGLVVLALATGLATLLGVALAARSRALRAREIALTLLLGLPGLVLWLPNPQPARHFFFPVLAACLLAALWLEHRPGGMRRAIGFSLLLVLANQLAAEALRAPIVSRYAWSYPAATPRRATQQVPLGLFPLDQQANQAQVEAERAEATALAAHAPERLVVLADFQHHLIARLIAADPSLQWSETTRDGRVVNELRSPGRRIVLVEKYHAWPRDAAAEILASDAWAGWPIYVQRSTLSRFDKTEIPAERRYSP